MADRRKRLAGNVAGPWFVDSSCIDCDACRQLELGQGSLKVHSWILLSGVLRPRSGFGRVLIKQARYHGRDLTIKRYPANAIAICNKDGTIRPT